MPFDEDLIKLKLDVLNPIKKCKEEKIIFGLIKKTFKLKTENDKQMLPPIKAYLKDLYKKHDNDKHKLKNTFIYELSILIRFRKYSTINGMIIEIHVNRGCFILSFYFTLINETILLRILQVCRVLYGE